MVIILGNGHRETSSNPKPVYVSLRVNTLEEEINPSLPLRYGQIIGKTRLLLRYGNRSRRRIILNSDQYIFAKKLTFSHVMPVAKGLGKYIHTPIKYILLIFTHIFIIPLQPHTHTHTHTHTHIYIYIYIYIYINYPVSVQEHASHLWDNTEHVKSHPTRRRIHQQYSPPK